MGKSRAPIHIADLNKWKSFRDIAKLLDWSESDLAGFLVVENIRVNASATPHAVINGIYEEFDDGSKWPIKRWDWCQIKNLAENKASGIKTKTENDAEASILYIKYDVVRSLKLKCRYHKALKKVSDLSIMEVVECLSELMPYDSIVQAVIDHGILYNSQETALRMRLALSLALEERKCQSRY